MSYSPAMQPGPDPDSNSRTVRNELQRIIAGPQFENADRLIRFLTFVVEEALAGRGDSTSSTTNVRKRIKRSAFSNCGPLDPLPDVRRGRGAGGTGRQLEGIPH